ncbi:MAG TPA: DUF835 domain-containing protein [Thermoplasmata archaeon]|nr:DUF835 domain-containing protein [Thermoplasmata archaeon]
MRSPPLASLALLLGALLLWSFALPAAGQSGEMTVTADYELFGTTALNGGGHVTWTLTGDVAREFRADLVHLFDEYAKIPQGFVYGGDPTNGNHDGVIQEPEGRAYTDRLENVLEGSYPNAQTGGTQVGYFLLDRANLLDKDLVNGFNTSTTGIVGSNANSTADLQIRFLFNGATNTGDVSMPLSTEAYAQALFQVFSIDARQAGSWPLQLAGRVGNATVGWQSLYYDATHPAVLWAGNSTQCPSPTTNCRYEPHSTFAAPAVMDGTLGAGGIPLDLRFASSAWITFNYTGAVATGDELQVQAARDTTNLTWTTLGRGILSVYNNTAQGVWLPMGVDMTSYLGQKVRLRLLFSAPGGTPLSGFFISNFAIHAPATYQGPVLESDAHYLIGTISFSNFNVPSGSPTLIRTPGGEILWYSSAYDTSSLAPDTVRYTAFDAMENPQVLFVVMCVAAYLISRFQEVAYDTYREAHPSVYRPAVHKVKWLHWLGKAAILVLILFYFIPTALFAIGVRVYFNGPAYFFLALTLALGLSFGTRAYYLQMLEQAPPPVAPETEETETPSAATEEGPAPEPIGHCTHCLRTIRDGEKTYACSCGALYHLGCASGLMRCSNCRKPVAGLETIGEPRSVSMRCSACGEIQTIPEGVDARTMTCASCGGSLRSLDAGKRYLLVASNPAIAFHWLVDLAKGGKPALVVTNAAPERLRLEFGLKDVQFAQVTAQVAGAIDPKRLDPTGLKMILPLTRSGKGGVILYDGLDQIVATSSLGDVVRFLRKANDMAFVHQITVIGRVGPGILAEAEIERLAAEFDELLDLSARL